MAASGGRQWAENDDGRKLLWEGGRGVTEGGEVGVIGRRECVAESNGSQQSGAIMGSKWQRVGVSGVRRNAVVGRGSIGRARGWWGRVAASGGWR